MAHLRCDFFSDVLGLSTSMTVLLPQRTSTQIGMCCIPPSEAKRVGVYRSATLGQLCMEPSGRFTFNPFRPQ